MENRKMGMEAKELFIASLFTLLHPITISTCVILLSMARMIITLTMHGLVYGRNHLWAGYKNIAQRKDDFLEKHLVLHCAPTLAGLKTASLFSYTFS